MKKTQERRAYSRVSIHVKGYMRRVPSVEAPPLFKDGPKLAAPDARAFRGVSLPEALVSFLNNMNNKLDLLLSLASQDQLQHDFPMVVDTAELSGSGVAIECSEELLVDEYVEIVMVLSQFPLKMGGAIGRVVRALLRIGSAARAFDRATTRVLKAAGARLGIDDTGLRVRSQ